MICLRAEGGLCNRLRAINSALCVARLTKHALRVFWKTDPEMNCGFASLFEEPVGFKVKDVGREGLLMHAFFSTRNVFTRLQGDGAEVVARVGKASPLRIWSRGAFLEFYRPEVPDYSWLRPLPSINKEVLRHFESFGPDAIGLHILRTDNDMAIKMSPLALFIDKIEEHLSAQADQRFFVATDDEPTKAALRRRFGDHIYTREDIVRREAAGGVQDAVVDLFLLSKCRQIYGSYRSSFSDVAADIGCKPYKRLVVKEA